MKYKVTIKKGRTAFNGDGIFQCTITPEVRFTTISSDEYIHRCYTIAFQWFIWWIEISFDRPLKKPYISYAISSTIKRQ